MNLTELPTPAEIQHKARESQLLNPTSEQVESRKKIFEAVDIATVKSGVIPRLHEMTEQYSGEPHTSIVLDTIELCVGTPFPTAVRYIVPFKEEDIRTYGDPEESDEEIEEAELPDFIPGLVIRQWPAGTTEIQVGIDIGTDAFKLHPRFSSVSHHWQAGKSFGKPYWWPYENIQAQDITQEYDLLIAINASASLVYADDIETGLGYYVVGSRRYVSKVGNVEFSTEDSENRTTQVWELEKNQKKLEEAFAYLETFFSDRRRSDLD